LIETFIIAVRGASIQIVHYFDHGYLEEKKSMIHSLRVTFGANYLTNMVLIYTLYKLKWEFAVVPTDNICGRSLSSKIPVDMNSIFMKLYVTLPT
jgi:hypothetical protein